MAIVGITKDGYKIAKGSGVADNSGGGSAADINVDITFSELSQVLYVISAYGDVAVTESSIDGNKVTVTAKSVPAGATATVYVVVVGY